MKQVVFKKGKALVVEAGAARLQNGMVLVELRASCISPGTEMSHLSSTGKSLLEKAKAHPDKLKRAIDRMKTEGVFSVVRQVQGIQGNEAACGYSAAGVVLDVASDVQGFYKGMRVAVAGAGYANHAQQVVVPVNLAMPIPEDVSFHDASTCALGGIALQGIRRAEPVLGDIVAVVGCGAIGLLTVQLLKASGCTVLAIDLDARRLRLAEEFGADLTITPGEDDPVNRATHFANGHGVDKVIVTAATQSNSVLSQAFGMCRRKGRVVLVGVVGPEINRNDMYAKELDFVISTSYGPGRYDEQYERFGHDYPFAYVRWTENRNMAAYLKCLATGSVKLGLIIEKSFSVEQAGAAYEALTSEEKPLLVLLSYPAEDAEDMAHSAEGVPPPISDLCPLSSGKSWAPPKDGILKVGLAGVGGFVQSMHIPNLKQLTGRYQVSGVCDISGLAARQAAKRFGGGITTTQYDELLQSDIDMVLIGTRHNTHAEFAIRALESGKAVFVEKPMCITADEYHKLCDAIEKSNAPFMVGYNRRFSPFALEIKKRIAARVNPLMIHYTMNAGYIPYSAWVHTDEGGGRIIGEGCHLFDLFRFLTGSPVVSVSVDAITPKTESVRPDDNAVITLKYEDGSVATLLYTAIGSAKAEKESMTVFCDEKLFEMHDYKELKAYGTFGSLSLKKQDKGHFHELEVFAEALRKGERFPIPLEEMKETWEISRQVADLLRTGN